MEVQIYLQGTEKNKQKTVTVENVMEYSITDQNKNLKLVLKSGETKNFELKTVDRAVVIKPFCIYHKDRGNMITDRRPGNDGYKPQKK